MILEPIRRTIWSFFTVENEHLRNTMGYRKEQFIPLYFERGVGQAPAVETEESKRKKYRDKLIIATIIVLVLILSLGAMTVLEEESVTTT
jgi:hypothetical protein